MPQDKLVDYLGAEKPRVVGSKPKNYLAVSTRYTDVSNAAQSLSDLGALEIVLYDRYYYLIYRD